MANDSDTQFGKQAKEIAEAANTSVDAIKKLAGFLDGMFGNMLSNSMGLLSDKLAYYRLEKAIALQHKVEENLRERGVKRRYVPVAFGLPIIEKATIEEDVVLQEKWANLLTNAMDVSYSGPLRRNYSSILADLEPLDAHLLDRIVEYQIYSSLKSRVDGVISFETVYDRAQHSAPFPDEKRGDDLYGRDQVARVLMIAERDCEIAVRNLIRLGLLKPGVIRSSMTYGRHNVGVYKDTELFAVTSLGVDFYHAVNSPPVPSAK